jgi:hypothetical protein
MGGLSLNYCNMNSLYQFEPETRMWETDLDGELTALEHLVKGPKPKDEICEAIWSPRQRALRHIIIGIRLSNIIMWITNGIKMRNRR